MDANMKVTQEEMKAQIGTLLSRIDAQHERLIAWLGTTEPADLEANPEEMQSEAEHREVPKKHAAVKPVRELRKRHRGRKVAAERRRKPKDGSRWKLVAARRGTTLSAKVTRRKGHGLQGQGFTENLEKTGRPEGGLSRNRNAKMR
jgi:hypothetical protein